MAVTNKACIEAYIGQSGSGKGVSIKARLKELAGVPLIIWDPRNEYGEHAKAVDMAGVLAAGRAIKAGKAPRVRFVHDGKSSMDEAFATICAVAFTAGNCVFLAEELSDVTKPSWAPPEWKRICTQGRHVGLIVLGAAQRPALIDKNFLGNCTYLRAFSLRYANDRRAVAEALDVPVADVAALVTSDDEDQGLPVITTKIMWLEKDFRRNQLTPGGVTVRKNREPT
ncbi:MAG: hypothetical protein WAQ08_05835 [Aquabacterium sp.]|uniref:hypothetical protein n=1 Tax=Aquabacterium sp. TaxID=1872578 RepID=UPI003BB190F1